MEEDYKFCLICYRDDTIDREQSPLENLAPIACQLLGLSIPSFEILFSSSPVCSICLQKLSHLDSMLKEISQIKMKILELKEEMVKDLMDSQYLSEGDGRQEDGRVMEARMRI